MRFIKNRIFLATICVIISAICVLSLVKTDEVEMITAYKITADISKGTAITDEMISQITVNATGMSEVITDETEIVGKFASYDLISGQFVYENSVADSQSEVLEGMEKVADGQIAYSISVKSLASSTSDKILSGDIVTVFVNVNGESVQPIELKYVEVLSASTSGGLEKTASSSESISTITFLATEEQALLLNEYEYSASIHLALVHRGEDDVKTSLLEEQINLNTQEITEDFTEELGDDSLAN
ncbi:MAG: RcpC/CpaB family pilus assembly protein [Clostridia bacterium]